jgi:hypothetical protein
MKLFNSHMRVYPKVSGLSHNEITTINALRSKTNCYNGRTHSTESKNIDTSTSSGREPYHLQLSLQAANSETFWYTHVWADEYIRERTGHLTVLVKCNDTEAKRCHKRKFKWDLIMKYIFILSSCCLYEYHAQNITMREARWRLAQKCKTF